MSFIFYDLIFLAVFSLAVGIFLYVERKKLVKDGPMFLYKTKIGLKVIEYLGKKFPKTLKVLSYISIIIGYLLIIGFFYMMYAAIKIFMNPEFVKIIKVPPIMPLIPYLPELFKIDWLPPFYFTYWIIGIALIAIFHEAAHGIFARFNNIKIKSTGFGFLGPFLAFFVEQDDKQMKKSKPFAQMSVLSAGVFANLILAVIFFLVMALFFHTAYAPSGVLVRGYMGYTGNVSLLDQAIISEEIINVSGINLVRIELENNSYFIIKSYIDQENNSSSTIAMFYPDLPALRNNLLGKTIVQIDNNKINTLKDLERVLSYYNKGDSVNISIKYILNKTQVTEKININFKEISSATGKPLIGIAFPDASSVKGLKGLIAKATLLFKDSNLDYTPKRNADFTIFISTLFWWILFINISVAVVNMMPVPLFDGGQFFYLTVLAITKKEKFAKKALNYMAKFILILFILMMILWVFGIFI